ncbi:MAG TPA: glycosyl hydrolase [Vicinamibacterales bacterium]|nr:glycosyl hydrolase [Vicinamibacterales bacterium]
MSLIRRPLSALIATFVAGAAVAATAPREAPIDLRAAFRAPDAASRPVVRWWWPDEGVADDELRREIDELSAGHFGGVEVVAGDAMRAAHFEPAAAAARARGLELVAAPSRDPRLELRLQYFSLEGPRTWRGNVGPLPAGHALVAVVATKGTAPMLASPDGGVSGAPRGMVLFAGRLDSKSAIVLTPDVASDGTLAWAVPDGQWQMVVVTQAPATPRAPIDLPWTKTFLADFARLRGYDPTPYLPMLWRPGAGDPGSSVESSPVYDAWDVGDRVRHDYWQTIEEIEEIEEIADAGADVPRRDRHDALTMAASAAHVAGQPIVEGAAIGSSNPYAATPEQLKREADVLFSAGATRIVEHGFAYTREVGDEPGWFPSIDVAPRAIALGAHNTFWAYLPAVQDYIARVQVVLQRSAPAADVAIYRPASSRPGASAKSEAALVERLRTSGYAFDIVRDEGVLGARASRRQVVTSGGMRYRALVLVGEPRIRLAIAEKLAAFHRAGVPIVIAGAVPSNEAGLSDWEAHGHRIRELLAPFVSVKDVPAAMAAVQAIAPPSVDRRGTSDAVFVVRRAIGDRDVLFVANPAGEARHVDLRVAASGSPESWDPWTGGIAPQTFSREGASVRVRFDLASGASRLIVIDPRGRNTPAASPIPEPDSPAEPAAAPMAIDGPWDLQAGDRTIALPSLVDWSTDERLAAFSGTARYSTRFTIPDAWFNRVRTNSIARPFAADARADVSLGRVLSVAEILVNGQPIATLVMPPYVADVSSPLRPGENRLEIRVTNSLVNRLAAKGVLFGSPATAMRAEPAGLLGPVTIVLSQRPVLP